MKCEEIAWAPMCVPEDGRPFFFDAGIRDYQKTAREDFAKYCKQDWKDLRKEGWRIVRVKLTTELH